MELAHVIDEMIITKELWNLYNLTPSVYHEVYTTTVQLMLYRAAKDVVIRAISRLGVTGKDPPELGS